MARSREQFAKSVSIPPPIGGWNARDPLDLMDAADAVRLENVFPSESSVSLRRGYASHATGMTGYVRTLAEYSDASGSRVLIAAANGSLWNASVAGAVGAALGTGFTEDRWQTVNFRTTAGASRLIMVNGADAPQLFNGTALVGGARPFYTGIGTESNLIHVCVYKSRLYFCEKNSTSIWYAAADTLTGALASYGVGNVMSKGGYPIFCGTWSRDTGTGAEELFIVVSNMGEILVYSGLNPGDSSWGLIGRFYMPAPLGRRAYSQVGPDMVIAHQQGVAPLSDILQLGVIAGANNKLTNKISTAIAEASQSYGTNQGWQVVYYPKGRYLAINVPLSTDGNSQQYVCNLLTGAWCKFTNQNAYAWATFNEDLYFGGANGVVYKADTGYLDDSSAISIDWKQAFNYFDDRGSVKRILMARPLVVSTDNLRFQLAVDADFQDRVLTTPATITGSSGSPWDTSPWDTSEWDSASVYSNSWYAITGIGRCFALRVGGSYKNIGWSVSSMNITYESGGFL